MIVCAPAFRWYLLLPVILATSALPLTAYAHVPHSGESLGDRLGRGLNLEYQVEPQQEQVTRQDSHVVYRRETIATGNAAESQSPLPAPDKNTHDLDPLSKTVLPVIADTSQQPDRELDLQYQIASESRFSHISRSYSVLHHDRKMELAIAPGPRRYDTESGTHFFDMYSYIEKTKPDRRNLFRTAPEGAPTILYAEQISGRIDREMNLDYLVEVERGQTRITGNHAVFRQEKNEIDVTGNAHLAREGDRYTAESFNFNLDTSEGTLNQVRYRFDLNNGQGKAERIDIENEYDSTVINGTYTTCEGEDPDWYLKTRSLDFDTARGIGTARTPVLYFKDVPILAASSLSFPLNNERKSGFLAPTFGMTSKSGIEILTPYYFNLAPNYDLTLFPKYLSKRGFQLGAKGRYLGNTYSGETYIEYLPNDNDANRDRYAISSKHTHNFAPGWSYAWNFNKASDDKYPDDITSPVTLGTRLLSQDGHLSYTSRYWNATAGVSRFQVLQDPMSPITAPYDRLPYLNVNANRYNVNGFDMGAHLQYTRFWLADDKLYNRERGDRYIVNPQISFPLVAPGYFVKPKASLHYARYDLDDKYYNVNQNRTMSRTIPTLSLDTGLIFESPTSIFGNGMTQTLEPRLFYVYTPYKDQSRFPVFDSGEPSFGYAQLFQENRFVGEDRIADANNLTIAVTSRFIEQSGAERMRFTAGQRYYFSDQRVALYSPVESRNENRSDLLLAASGMLTSKFAVDATIQYNQSTRRLYSANYSAQWRPADKKVLNAEYRYLRQAVDEYGNAIDQINLSGQWPLWNRWYVVGQVSYSLPDNKTIESLLGIEYNADCWIGRIVAQRYVTSSVASNTALFFQLELKGMSKIGSNPLEVLRKSIPGYRPLTSFEN